MTMKNKSLKERMLRWVSKLVEDIILPMAVLAFSGIYWGAFLTRGKYGASVNLLSFLIEDLGKYLMTEDGSIVTVATVFIGIYFSIYTMLTSIQTDSVMSNLGKKNFQKLLNILGVGFLSSFAYTLYSVFFGTAYSTKPEVAVFFVLLLLIIFMLSAFQFGVIIYIILKKDIAATIEDLDERKKKELKQLDIQQKLEAFLDKENKKEILERAEKTSEILRNRQDKEK